MTWLGCRAADAYRRPPARRARPDTSRGKPDRPAVPACLHPAATIRSSPTGPTRIDGGSGLSRDVTRRVRSRAVPDEVNGSKFGPHLGLADDFGLHSGCCARSACASRGPGSAHPTKRAPTRSCTGTSSPRCRGVGLECSPPRPEAGRRPGGRPPRDWCRRSARRATRGWAHRGRKTTATPSPRRRSQVRASG
jgi:hypothetical protein